MEAAKENLREIVESVNRGSEEAFEQLYRVLNKRIFAYIVPRVSDRAEALDLLQEIFLDLWSARTRFEYRNDVSVYGFVFTVVRRTLAKHYDDARRRLSIAELPPQDDRYDMDVEGLERVHTIERALTSLSEDDNELITLRYFSGFSFKEIGDIQGKEEGTVRVNHHRALLKLKPHLNNYES